MPLLLLSAAGCRNPAPGYTPVATPPVVPVALEQVKTGASLMPLDEGNRWTYALQEQTFEKDRPLGTTDLEVDYVVERTSPGGEATVVLMRDGKAIDQQVWRSSDAGLFQVASGLPSIRFSPEQPLAFLPLKAGRRFVWQGRGIVAGGKAGHAKATGEILSPQNVDCGLGTLSAVPVTTRTAYEGGRIDNTTWFRPGVGFLRLRQETTGDDGHRQILLLTLTHYAIKR